MKKIPYLTSRRFNDWSGEHVAHGFFGRKGGVSEDIYESLNCGKGSEDNPNNVDENTQRVLKTIGGDTLQKVYQHHSNICVFSSDFSSELVKADAQVTDVKGLVLGILTADCAPILFSAIKGDGKPIIGAAHAGWQGALKGVLENTLKEMHKSGAVMETVSAIIGPCISQLSYEVTKGFEEPFLKEDEKTDHFFANGKGKDKLHFDLGGYVVYRLSRAGVKNVIYTGIDTYSNADTYFSNRRRVHNGEHDYGRQISTIVIR